MKLITVTRPDSRRLPIITVYSDGKPVVAVPISQREALTLIADLAKEAIQ